MVKNYNELINKFNEINQLIPSFDTDERKEIKKNNKIINDYLEELAEIKPVLLEVIKTKKDKMIPTVNDELCFNEKEELFKKYDKVRYLANNNFIAKLNIDKNLYEIKNSGSLDKVNENLIDLIDKFLLIDVKLTANDFKYSMALYKYMSFFFDNLNSDDFNKLMTNLFDSLYWECSDIIYHIYLSCIFLLNKYEDKFEIYIKKNNGMLSYDDEFEGYLSLKKDIDNKININDGLIYQKFINNEYRIEDYLIDSVYRKDVVSKYVNYDKYLNYSLEDRNYFYEQINGMYLDFCEYLDLTKYNFLVDKVREIYNSKNNYTNNFNTFKSKIKGLEKQREKLNNKIFSMHNKIDGKTRGILFNKYNNLINKVNAKITEIIEGYNSYDFDCFVNDVITKLNDDSNWYEALKIYENNYSYLVSLLKENNCDYDEFIDFLCNPYLSICRSIPFINEFNIKDKLINKYDLFDMNFNISDEGKLYQELIYMVRLWYFDNGNIDLNKIKLIMDVNKLKVEEI